MKVYVALTSWPKRIVTAHETIESMLNQSAHIDGVELNLYSGDFPDGISNLPKNIRDIYVDVPNFSIHFHDHDLKVWLKSVPSIRRHRGEEYTLFTLDDDCVYDVDYVLEGLSSLDSGDFDAINNQSGVWETRLLDEIAYLVVGQPFFVQATADGSVIFAPTPSNIAARRNMRAKEERKMLRLTFEADKTDSHVDRLYLTLHDDDLCGSYTLGRDLMRMESSCKTVPQFWCLAEDGTQLNAHGISIPETETIVPIELFVPANGRYLLTVRPEQMEDFVAELLYQGTYAATLFDAQPLTLDLPSGTTSDYSLRIRRKAPQGLNDVQSDKEQCTKVLHEGHMYILQGGQIFDAQGKKVK